jgi:hypothetical protein
VALVNKKAAEGLFDLCVFHFQPRITRIARIQELSLGSLVIKGLR